MTTPDIISALHPVVKALEQLSIPYYIGGSVASSIYGMARATMDVDIVAEIKNYHVARLKAILAEGFYCDEEMILEAIKNRTSFNLIHFETAFKIDIFISQDEPYCQNVIERKVRDTLSEEADTACYFSSPEDIIIAKLQWFEQGNRISERQWLDVLGVIKVQADNLDQIYLTGWSKKLGLYPLLQKAFDEAGVQLQDQK